MSDLNQSPKQSITDAEPKRREALKKLAKMSALAGTSAFALLTASRKAAASTDLSIL